MMNLEKNKTDFNSYNDKMNAAMCGERNWISNLLEKTRMQHHES